MMGKPASPPPLALYGNSGVAAGAVLYVVAIVAVVFLFGLLAPAHSQEPPRAAAQYQRELTRVARSVWGLDAPVRTFAAQVHQESGWRADARSKYAGGLAQFTPDTAAWIGGLYRSELGNVDPFNPGWALRALVRYDHRLFLTMSDAATPCDRWAFVLSAYNGGPGWVDRDKLLARAAGADPARWWGNVELYSERAAWAKKENRDYPRRILVELQPRYARWGLGPDCQHVRLGHDGAGRYVG